MLPKKDRLSRAAFSKAASSRKRVSTPHFSFSAANDARGCAVVISKKVAKRSVDRHLLKRRMTALLSAEKRPPALIVYARAGAPALSYAEIREELRAGLKKLS